MKKKCRTKNWKLRLLESGTRSNFFSRLLKTETYRDAKEKNLLTCEVTTSTEDIGATY